MNLQWLIQGSFSPAKCRLCARTIPAMTIYFRATLNPDTPDEQGYDCCPKCRKLQPETPLQLAVP